jgi:hypothetical protein
MLHPTHARALATAHIEDLQRAAARSRAVRLPRDVLQERQLEEPSVVGRRSAWAWLRGLRASTMRHSTNRDSASGPVAMPICPGRPLGAESRNRQGIE